MARHIGHTGFERTCIQCGLSACRPELPKLNGRCGSFVLRWTCASLPKMHAVLEGLPLDDLTSEIYYVSEPSAVPGRPRTINPVCDQLIAGHEAGDSELK